MKMLWALVFVPALAQADIAGRWLPRGEEASVIQHVYASPFGDLEFLLRGEAHSVLLRNIKGGLMEMTKIEGPVECDQWFISEKTEPLPRGCEFQFYSKDNGSYTSVRSEEMEESSLFQAVSGSVRGRGNDVTL